MHRKGFTLIEVLLAALIMSIGLSGILLAASRCLAGMKKSQHYQTAQFVLQYGEATHPITETNAVESIAVASESTPVEGFTFSRDIEDDEDEDGLHVVRSRATWSSSGQESFEEVVRYVYRPEVENK